VLEASTVGAGASGRSGGVVLDDTAAGPLPGFAGCLDSVAELVTAERIECDWVLGGCWEISHGKNGRDDSPIDWSDNGQRLRVCRLVPGGTVDPGKLLAGLARAAVARGAQIYERCRVTALEFGRPLRLRTTKGWLAADCVVLATNAYSSRMSELEEFAVPLLTIAVASEPLSVAALRQLGLESRRPFYTDDLPYLWGRLTPDNRLVLGSGLLSAPDGEVEELSVKSAEARLLFTRLERRIRGLHPALARLCFTHRWAGPIAITHDWCPVLRRHSRSPRVVVAGGYCGHGLAQAIRMGRLIAERLPDDWLPPGAKRM